jgi:hypothetical protein
VPGFLTNSRQSAIRAAIRAAVVCVTAFGLKLSVDQVAAIQLATEAAIALAVALTDD